MKIGLSLLVGIVLLFFMVISGAIIYHIWKYSPDRESALYLLFIYLGVSLFFIFLVLIAFLSLLLT